VIRGNTRRLDIRGFVNNASPDEKDILAGAKTESGVEDSGGEIGRGRRGNAMCTHLQLK